MKKYFANPYTFIFLATFYGVWLVWNSLFIPYRNPYHVVGLASQQNYNPNSNILRFVLALALPPLACLVYWAVHTHLFPKFRRVSKGLKITTIVLVVIASLAIASGMAIVQSSTSGTNDKYVYGGPYKYTLVDSFHEGETLGTAVSYEQKDLKPYRDFLFVHGVFQDPVRSITAFKLFGRSIGAERAFNSILTIIAFVLLYIFLVIMFKGNVYKAGLGIVSIGLLLLPVASSTLPFLSKFLIGIQMQALDISTLLFLIFAILSLRFMYIGKVILTNVFAFLLGVTLFTAYANSIDRGFFLSGLFVAWLLILLLTSPFKRLIKTILPGLVCGSLLGIFILGIALKGDFKDFAKFLFGISRYKEYMDGFAFDRPDLSIALILVFLSGLFTYAGARVISHINLASAKTRQKKLALFKNQLGTLLKDHYTFVLLLLASVIYLRSAIGRADYGHFAYSILPTYILLVYVVVEYLWVKPLFTRYLIPALSIVLLTFTTIYYGVLVNRIDMPKNTFPTTVADKDLVRPDYLDTAAYIKSHTSKDQTFVTLTSEGLWYYLVNKPSPVRYPIVWFSATEQQRQQLAASLSNNKNIKFVITNNNWTSDIDNVPANERMPEVYEVLYSQFTPKIGIGQQTVWER